MTDDGSSGIYGGTANGVHVTNKGSGNAKAGSSKDFVLGANNDWSSPTSNYHSSGIVSRFSHGATRVSFDCTDDDRTLKRLFAFDADGALIGTTPPGSQINFAIDVNQTTNGALIYAVEFDTEAGSKGGASDGTYFTLDNFRVSGVASEETKADGDIAIELLSRVLNPGNVVLIDLGQKRDAEDELGQTTADNLLFAGTDGFHVLFLADDSLYSNASSDVRVVSDSSGARIETVQFRGLVAVFNYGVKRVVFTANNSQVVGEKLFAYDMNYNTIAIKSSDGKRGFSVDMIDTSGRLIYAVELDVYAGKQTEGSNAFSMSGLRCWGSARSLQNVRRDVFVRPLRKLASSSAAAAAAAASKDSGGTSRLLAKLDFNCGADSMGQSSGDLVFDGVDGFQMLLTDDDSDGAFGGQANGVHITNKDYGNSKDNTADLVIGANNNWPKRGQTNYHSSGIVAKFTHGVERVRIVCTDDDSTKKTLYAFDESGAEIGRTASGSQRPFVVDLALTKDRLIYAIEFDTLPGTAGGSADGTYFTIDDVEIYGRATNATARSGSASPASGGFLNVVATRRLATLSFDSKLDSFARKQGDLVFLGSDDFRVLFTDDDSSGASGGQADGVHITNKNYGNSKVGSASDYVLGAYNGRPSSSVNYHSSGIVARFSHGVSAVGLTCTDNDGTTKSLFAFDEWGTQIGKTKPGSRIPFRIDTTSTSGKLIYAVEFDTLAGTAGGSNDGTVFTIDDFYVDGPLPCAARQTRRFSAARRKSDYVLAVDSTTSRQVVFLDFNSGVDHEGRSQGDLVFVGDGGLVIVFVDDDSSGSYGGDADGVHISNLDYGNDKDGSDDLVLGAYNSAVGGSNYHSSGIVARFSHGMQRVSLECTDDDSTTKTLFAFDEDGKQIGKTAAGSRRPFVVDTTMTNGGLIYSVEFDTKAGTAGGSFDGTYFTIDNFKVEGIVNQETARNHF